MSHIIYPVAITPKGTTVDIHTHGHAIGDDDHSITIQTGHRPDRITIQQHTGETTEIHCTASQALSLVLSIMEAVSGHAGSPETYGDTATATDRIQHASTLHYLDTATDECAHDGKGWPCPTVVALQVGDPA